VQSLPPRPARRRSLRSRRSAFTLVEVLIASLVMTILLGGLLALMIQSRRLTDGSVLQNSAVTILQGYIEQMKNMDYASLAISPSSAPGTPIAVPTVLDEVTPDPLTVSWGSPPTTLPAIGTTPSNAIDNVKNIAMKNPAVTPADTLSITIWLWVQDLTGTATDVTNSKAVTMIYTYQFRDGGRLRYFRGSIRTIRSIVPSF
jgi:Tfp pilus assembly protein PilV